MRRFDLDEMRSLKLGELAKVNGLLAKRDGRPRPVLPFPPRGEGVGIIAEVKKASPTLGDIRSVSPRVQAGRYLRGGACALSVLTDGSYFGGSWADLWSVARDSEVPVLCKEFIYFEEQVELAHLMGADAVLLIAGALSEARLGELYARARLLALTPVIEVHRPEELRAVLDLDPECVLVNARDLRTLEIDIAMAARAFTSLPRNVRGIWASGINGPDDIASVRAQTGAGLFLVGTSLMKANDPLGLLRRLADVR